MIDDQGRTDDVATLADDGLDYLDGQHHAWCHHCYPLWAARPLGAELGKPFVAWCGQRAIYLAVWQSEDVPPGPLCSTCWDAPLPPCATCGKTATPDSAVRDNPPAQHGGGES